MTLPLEKSYYAARATSTPIAFGMSNNNNTEIAVEFEILEDAFAGETITWVGHFTDKTAERTIESLQIAGWQGDDLSDLAGQPGSQMLPAEVSLTVEGEEYDGQWRPKVQWVNRPGGGKFKFKNEISGADLKAFSAQMRNTVKAVRAAGGAPRKPSGSGGGSSRNSGYSGRANSPRDRNDIPPPSDNDIPF